MAFANERVNGGWLRLATANPGFDEDQDIASAPNPAAAITRANDPHLELLKKMAVNSHRLYLGLTEADFNLSAPRRNVAFLGAPRSNKSASVVAMANAHVGPLFVVTTRRFEFAEAIGHGRARIGGTEAEMIHIDLDGGSGAKELAGWSLRGWTPITTDVRTAYARAKAMTEAYEMGNVTNGSFWAVQATDVLYPLLLAAGLSANTPTPRGIEWVRRLAKTGTTSTIGEAVTYLQEAISTPGINEAIDALYALEEMAPETRGSVLATASGALSAYALPDAVAATKRTPVDLEAFVRGHGGSKNNRFFVNDLAGDVGGCFGTILVTGSSSQQRLLRPLVVGITADLRDICFRIAGEDTEAKVADRRSTLAILDDMPTLAPDRDLPSTLAQSGGQNLLICGIYHDDAQLRAQWGEEGSNMATTFGEQICFRGIRDTKTLERIAAVTGQRFLNIRGQSVSQGRSREGRSYQEGLTVTPTLLPELTEAQINQGHPDDPDIVLSLHPAGWEWAYSTPYYSHPMWLRLMIRNVGLLATLPPQRLHLLAPPDIGRDNGYEIRRAFEGAEGAQWADYFVKVAKAFEERGRQYREIKKSWAAHPALAHYDDALSPDRDRSSGAVETSSWVLLDAFDHGHFFQIVSNYADWHTLAASEFDRSRGHVVSKITGVPSPGVEPITITVWSPAPLWNDPGFRGTERHRQALGDLGQPPAGGIEIVSIDRPGDCVRSALADLLVAAFKPRLGVITIDNHL